MIIANYGHRLPADYDIAQIRARAQQRGPLWDDVAGLYLKAFLLRERGRFGASANSYSSLYLWRDDNGFRDFVADGRFRVVTDTFGRAEIATRFALDARRGAGRNARFAYQEEVAIPLDADLATVMAGEIERNRHIAGTSGAVAAVVGVDPLSWNITRILLSEHEPAEPHVGTSYEILHLARPLLETLPTGA